MVKLRGPLFSLEAAGSLADCLTYQSINNIPIAKSLRFPTYIRTEDQAIIRDIFDKSSNVWAIMHDPKKIVWQEHTDSQLLTGYKAFMSTFLKRTYLALWQFELPPDQGFCTTGNHNVGEFVVGGGRRDQLPYIF